MPVAPMSPENPEGLLIGFLILSAVGALTGGMAYLGWQFANYMAQNPPNLPPLPSEQAMMEIEEGD